ncbi:MAG: hypothetical protein QM790_20220 [Nibricoccus sp.]
MKMYISNVSPKNVTDVLGLPEMKFGRSIGEVMEESNFAGQAPVTPPPSNEQPPLPLPGWSNETRDSD